MKTRVAVTKQFFGDPDLPCQFITDRMSSIQVISDLDPFACSNGSLSDPAIRFYTQIKVKFSLHKFMQIVANLCENFALLVQIYRFEHINIYLY